MKMIFSFFLFFPLILFPTEERNYFPFYHISVKKLLISIKSPDIELCSMKTEEIFNYALAKKENCTLASGNLGKILKKLKATDTNRKEYLFLLLNKEGEKVPAKITLHKKEYKLISIVHSQKEKSAFLELEDSDSNYFFYTVNPKITNFQFEK